MMTSQSSKGSILLLSTFVLMSVAVLVTAYWILFRIVNKSYYAREKGIQAYYAALAGVNDALAEIKAGNDWSIADVSTGWELDSGSTFYRSSIAAVPLTHFDYPVTYSVTVTGDPAVATVNIVSQSQVKFGDTIYSRRLLANVIQSVSGDLIMMNMKEF